MITIKSEYELSLMREAGKIVYETHKYLKPYIKPGITTGELADLFCKYWKGAEWLNQYDGGPYESGCLKLDCRKIRNVFGWRPRWSVEEAVKKTVEWYQAYSNGEDMILITNQQIGEMFNV